MPWCAYHILYIHTIHVVCKTEYKALGLVHKQTTTKIKGPSFTPSFHTWPHGWHPIHSHGYLQHGHKHLHHHMDNLSKHVGVGTCWKLPSSIFRSSRIGLGTSRVSSRVFVTQLGMTWSLVILSTIWNSIIKKSFWLDYNRASFTLYQTWLSLLVSAHDKFGESACLPLWGVSSREMILIGLFLWICIWPICQFDMF